MAVIKTFGKEYHHVLKCDRDLPEEEQTRFVYKIPPLEARFGGSDEISFKGDPEKKKDLVTTLKTEGALKSHINIVRSCIVRIMNLKNDEGEDVTWPSTEDEQDKILASFDPKWITELSDVFSLIVKVDEEEEKN